MSRKRLHLKADALRMAGATITVRSGSLEAFFPAIRDGFLGSRERGTSNLPLDFHLLIICCSSNYVKLVPNFIMKQYFQMKSAYRKSIVKFFK